MEEVKSLQNNVSIRVTQFQRQTPLFVAGNGEDNFRVSQIEKKEVSGKWVREL